MLFPRIIFNEINYDNWEQESISTPFFGSNAEFPQRYLRSKLCKSLQMNL